MEGLLAALPAWLTEPESAATAYTVLQWTIRVLSLIIVPFRRSPSAAKAWLLLIFFQPLVGLGLYLIFGRAIQPRWLQRRRRAWGRMFGTILQNISTITTKRGLNLKHDLPLQATYLQKHFPLPPSGGNKVELIADYDTFNDQLIADIQSARHHVHLLFYIFKNDTVGNRVVAALGEAAARGVTCRVLLDAIGSWPRARIRHRLKKAGVHVHSALPLSRKGWHTRADLRNHRKIAVIDGTVAYTGSQNIVKPANTGKHKQQELMVRLHGPSVLGMQAIFAADWFLESEEVLDEPVYYPLLPKKPYGDVITQVLPSGPDYPGASVDDLLVTLIHNARSKVVITTPYFIPSDPLLHALKSAVKRGVEVHLITSRQTDSWLVLLAQRSYYSELLKANIHVHLYKSSFLHSKHLSIDGIACLIGSSNIDLRSFELNGEINLMVYSDKVTGGLGKLENTLIASSQTLHLKKWHKRSYVLKLLENLARLLSPLL
jgi:cardiolipin synthase A/B